MNSHFQLKWLLLQSTAQSSNQGKDIGNGTFQSTLLETQNNTIHIKHTRQTGLASKQIMVNMTQI